MKEITYKLLPFITEEILEKRYECFNESLQYYKNFEASKEDFDKHSFHLQLSVNGALAAYTRLTPCPFNYMNVCKSENIVLPNDENCLEMGRTFVLPEFRGLKLVNTILLIGLRMIEELGYKKVIGNESYEDHLSMPSNNGWEFINVVADFKMPFSNKGKHKFYVIECDLGKTKQLRKERLEHYTNFLNEKSYKIVMNS